MTPFMADKVANYEAARHRFGYPPYRLATIAEVAEVLGCTGCPIEWQDTIRVVHVLPDCPAHRAPDRLPAA